MLSGSISAQTDDKAAQGTVAERVAAALRDEIAAGQWPIDAMLPAEHQLMTRFEVSRPSCREALRILQSEGLVRVERGSRGGARVLPPDASRIATYSTVFLQMRNATIAEVFETRVVIESAAAAAFTSRATPALLSELAQNTASERYLVHDRPAFYARGRKFRQILVENCGSESLRLMGLVIGGIADRQLSLLSVAMPDDPGQADRFLKSIRLKDEMIEAIERGDAETAAELWRTYLRRYLADLYEYLPENLRNLKPFPLG
ncbi:MAG: GntR family transcriptional regulator [Novosphingobium sp.]|nr:GntR family transcriptional regulator [Novosphingobium sp.]